MITNYSLRAIFLLLTISPTVNSQHNENVSSGRDHHAIGSVRNAHGSNNNNIVENKRQLLNKAGNDNKKPFTLDLTDIRPNIVGGTFSEFNRYPYLVNLVRFDEMGELFHFCAGTVIAPDVLLTAAHCVEPNHEFRVELGRHDREAAEGTYSVLVPEKVFIHPLYHSGSVGYPLYDLALIKVFGESTTPVVQINREPALPFIGDKLTVMGWGRIETTGAVSSALRETELKAVFCDPIPQSVICAGEIGADICKGDSGGPLLISGENHDEDMVVGISSFNIGECNDGKPSGFTRVSKAREWITDTVCMASLSPPDNFNCEEIERLPSDQIENPVVLRFEIDLGSNPTDRGWYLQSINEDGFMVTNANVLNYAGSTPDTTITEEVTVEYGNFYHLQMIDYSGNPSGSSHIKVFVDDVLSDEIDIPPGPWFTGRLATLDIGSPEDIVPESSPESEILQDFITIAFFFDKYPEEVGYYVEAVYDDGRDPDTLDFVAAGDFGPEYEYNTTEITIPLIPLPDEFSQQHYRVTVIDTWADGLHGLGYYEIWQGLPGAEGRLIKLGKYYGFDETTYFVDPFRPPTLSPTTIPTAMPTGMPSVAPITLPPVDGASGTVTNFPTVAPSSAPTVSNEPSYQPSKAPTLAPVPPPVTPPPQPDLKFVVESDTPPVREPTVVGEVPSNNNDVGQDLDGTQPPEANSGNCIMSTKTAISISFLVVCLQAWNLVM